ncbi:conjugal transfer protein [Paenibacillus pasadenensis]|uniref:conjugal transfer protein n=1 Tax=Paenibacillus pasadenensis TaxID=217090 RepID=UPI00041133DA|nr:conjugal transfer protein [Paenibacillus pasadenensis]
MAEKSRIPLPIVPGKSFKTRFMLVVRYITYAVMVVVMIRGVVSIIQPGQAASAPVFSVPASVSDDAQSFAQAFAKQLYSYNPKVPSAKEAYYNGLDSYLAQGVSQDAAGLNYATAQGAYSVSATYPWRVKQISSTRSDIDVRVDVKRVDTVSGAAAEFTRFIRVPVLVAGDGFVVPDLPTAIPVPVKEPGEMAGIPQLDGLDAASSAPMKQAVEDFFVAYSTDTSSKLKYFMADGKEIQGYNGTFVFNQISQFGVYLPAESDATSPIRLAYVESQWTDEQGFVQVQRHTLELVFKEERWYIKSITGGYQQ